MRKTKIICTLGPAVDDEGILTELFNNGMDIARMNFSHDNHEGHKKRVERFKKVREIVGRPVPLLLDTKGPEIRTGIFEKGEETLKEGNTFILTSKDVLGNESMVSISYKDLYKDVKKGSRILINDGLVELEVKEIKNKDIVCTVINGGTIGNTKGINVPDAEINLPSLTSQDVADIIFGIENGFDFIAASFVRKASDVVEIRKVLDKHNGSDIKVIAKIENREGIRNFDEILKVADGIMVARGDLGVEISVEEVPIVQKMLIEKCYRAGKPVITATQMLDSMIRNPRPTRAEASDIANAIYDGTSVIMLSGETAAGKYPVESLRMMSKIALEAEKSMDYWKRFTSMQFDLASNVTNAISHATCTTAMDLKAGSDYNRYTLGKYGKNDFEVQTRMSYYCNYCIAKGAETDDDVVGVKPYLVKEASSTDEMFDMGVEKALESGCVRNGDLVVITAGVPIGVSGTTNILKVHTVGKVLVQGTGIDYGSITGEICVVNSPEEARNNFVDKCILVASFTTNDMLPILKRASAIIVEESGISSHAAIVGLTLEIPVIIGAENATKILKSGSVVTVDSSRGIVYSGNMQE